MPDEIEIKFLARVGDLHHLNQLPWVCAHAMRPATRRTLVSVYYDTKRHALYKKGLSLRIRHDGDRRIQTIKAREGSHLFARKEWEAEVFRDHPDLSPMRGTALGPLLNKIAARGLKPVFETRVRRTTRTIRSGNDVVELAADRGIIRCGDRSSPISEVELELKAGGAVALFKIARKLSNQLPIGYSAETKLDRGMALLDGRPEGPFCGATILLSKQADTAAAFEEIAYACFRHMIGNEVAVCNGDEEGIHQMRVGMRRLRVALSIFKSLLRDREFQRLKSQLEWLDRILGKVRDLDVLLEEEIGRAPRSTRRMGKAASFHAILAGKRQASFQKVKAVLAGRRYRQLKLHIALWLAGGAWRKNTSSASPGSLQAKRFARKALLHLSKKIAREIHHMERLDDRRRHKLRIAVKKVRYAAEFFESLFDRRGGYRKCLKALGRLQEVLGRLNDLQTERRAIAGAAQTAGAKFGGVAMQGLDDLSQKRQRSIEDLQASAGKAGKKLREFQRILR